MGEHRRVHRIQFRGVDVGPDHALLQVVEHDVLAAPAQGPEGFFVQACPGLLAGLPDHLAETLARELERHHEQVRAAVLAVGVQRGRALAVVDLRFLPGQELEHVEAFRCAALEARHEALHRVVGVGEAVQFHQVLVDAHGVAPELDLGLDPGPVRRTRRQRRRRWPGWGNLLVPSFRAGGHPGGICPLVATDGLAIHPGESLDLPLRRTLREQRANRGQQLRLQDVHSFPLTMVRGNGNVPPRGAPIRRRYARSGGGNWGGHEWRSLGGRRGPCIFLDPD